MRPPVIFEDSHGGFWVVCHQSHPQAKAFGPYGAARELCDANGRRMGRGNCPQAKYDYPGPDEPDWVFVTIPGVEV